MKTTQERLITLVAEQLGLPENEVTLEKRLKEDLRADSLDAVEVMMAVEDEFGFDIPDYQLTELKTVQQILDYVEERLR